jgi:hypothetical protein
MLRYRGMRGGKVKGPAKVRGGLTPKRARELVKVRFAKRHANDLTMMKGKL